MHVNVLYLQCKATKEFSNSFVWKNFNLLKFFSVFVGGGEGERSLVATVKGNL